MKIIAVENRRKKLSAVRFEDSSELMLDTEMIIEKGLKPGVFIDDPDALLYDSDLKRAKSRALWYLSRGDMSKKTLFDKLKTAGFGEKAVWEAVLRMQELDLINDEKYAARLAEHLNSSGHSEKEIYFKLLNKGIPSATIKAILLDTEFDEVSKILKLLKSKYQTKLQSEGGAEKVIASLARKGYCFSDIKDAIKAYNEEINSDEDY